MNKSKIDEKLISQNMVMDPEIEDDFIEKIKNVYNVKEISDLNLWQKISAIQNWNISITKSGNNSQFKKYKTWTDVKKAVYDKLFLLHLTIIEDHLGNEEINFVNEIRTETRYDNDRKMEKEYPVYQVQATKKWKVVNADKPEEFHFITKRLAGTNRTLDWAIGTLDTYGLKYLFETLFLIPDETLDSDNLEIQEINNFTVPETAYIYLKVIKICQMRGKETQMAWKEFLLTMNMDSNWENWNEQMLSDVKKWIEGK